MPRLNAPGRATLAPQGDRFYFWSGRVALYALLRALKVRPPDEIIVPVYTCPAVIEPIVGLGAKAVYCDIERGVFGIKADEALDAITDRTKAIVVQHTFGIPAGSLEEISRFAKDRRVPILEDCCHVSSSSFRGLPLGRFGDAAFHSHCRDKPLSVGIGGVAVVNSPSLLEAATQLYSEFVDCDLWEETGVTLTSALSAAKRMARTSLPNLYAKLRSRQRSRPICDCMPPTAYRLTEEYQRRMPRVAQHRLRLALRDPSPYVSARKWAIEIYEAGFRTIGIEVFRDAETCQTVLWRYPIFAANKLRLLKEASRCGVALSDWGTIPLRSLANAAPGDGAHKRCFPVAEGIARSLVTLHIDEYRGRQEIDRTLEFLQEMRKRGVL